MNSESLYDLIFNFQGGIFLHSLVETLLSTGGQSECEVAVQRLREGRQHHKPLRNQSNKHGQDAQQHPGCLHGQA